MSNIILIGFKNSGKTSVGKALSHALKKSFLDTDHVVEQDYFNLTQTKKRTDEIYRSEGEAYFRALEALVIQRLVWVEDSVISTGGGCLLLEKNVVYLKQCGKLVYLSTSMDELKKRGQHKDTPAFLDSDNAEKSWMEMYCDRKSIYEQWADLLIETDGKIIDEIVEEILKYGE